MRAQLVPIIDIPGLGGETVCWQLVLRCSSSYHLYTVST